MGTFLKFKNLLVKSWIYGIAMDDDENSGQKPPLDWSLVKAYAAGIFTATVLNRYLFLGGLIGVFTGKNICICAIF